MLADIAGANAVRREGQDHRTAKNAIDSTLDKIAGADDPVQAGVRVFLLISRAELVQRVKTFAIRVDSLSMQIIRQISWV